MTGNVRMLYTSDATMYNVQCIHDYDMRGHHKTDSLYRILQ